MNQDIERGKNLLDLIQIVYPMNGILLVQSIHPISVFAEKVTPDNNEMCGRIRGADFFCCGKKNVMPLPRDEMRGHADDRDVLRQRKTSPRLSLVAGHETHCVDAIVEHENPVMAVNKRVAQICFNGR